MTRPAVSRWSDKDGSVSYGYDANGNVLTVSDENGTITREYDPLNRVTQYTDTQGNTLQYVYDPVGNLVTLIYPDGRQVRYDYNAVNQLVSVIDWAGRQKHYYYDDNGRAERMVRPNGTELTLSYNAAGQLVQQRDVDSQGQIISQFELVYDAAGNIIKEDTLPAPEPFVLPSVQLTYSLANQLATYNEQATQFDADGNMTYGPLKAQMVNFSYDSRNRLTQVGNTNYRYNAENQRVGVSVSGQETRYVVNSEPALSQTLVRTRPDGTQTYYVYGLGLMAEETNGEYLTYHSDLRGSTVALTDSTGQVNAQFQYTPFGTVVSATPVETPFLYHGMYGVMTDESGFYVQDQKYFVMLSLYFCLSHTFVAHIIIMCFVPNQSIPRLKNSNKIWLFLSDTIAKKSDSITT